MKFSERKILAILRQYGYKLTPQRRAVIQAITSSQGRLTPAAIYNRVHQDQPNIGFATIYRNLELLAKLNLTCELHTGGSCHSYTISSPQHHHHLICSHCGKVVDFAGYDLSELEQRLSRETGFDIEAHLLEFTGLCQACQKEAA